MIDKDISKNRSRNRSISVERHRRRRVEELRDYEDKRRKTHERSKIRYSRSRGSTSRDIERKRYEDKLDGGDNTNKRKRSRDIDDEDERSDDDTDKKVAKKLRNSRKNAADENLMTRTGGAYIPPACLRMMREKITDKNSTQYQRIAWEALKKSIHGLINKVTASNVIDICKELFQENIVRGRGLLVKSLLQAQSMSMTFTHVFAALAAVVNSKFPQVGELLTNRLVLQFKRGFKRNNKELCLSSTKFIAHLCNQKVVDEVIPFEILILLLEKPTNDSVEVAIGFLKECGRKLTDDSATATMSIFDSLKNILNEATIDTRVTYMIEVMFAIRKDGYKDYPTVISELDLVDDEDQFVYRTTLEDDIKIEDRLNVFEHDPHYEENENKYNTIKEELFGGDSDDEVEEESSDEDEENKSGDEAGESQVINDQTETNLVTLRKTIYQTINSSLNHEECAHKLLKMQLKPGQEHELCNMIMDCSAQEKTYIAFYGLLAQKFCNLDKKYVEPYEKIFREQYDTAHRLETNKIRNIAKLFSHLLLTDAISWEVLQCIKLNDEDTTPSSRIFLKHLFQDLSQNMGLVKLDHRFKDPTLAAAFEGMFPKSNSKDTRFAINYFTSVGLGKLTEELREHLKTTTSKQKPTQQRERTMSSSTESSSASSSSP